jgi:hydroxyacylglutathione hydrolase
VELINSLIYRIQNKIFPSNTYLVVDNLTNKCAIIDPGLDVDIIVNTLIEYEFIPLVIISTHGHFDHVGGVKSIQKLFDIPFYIHEKEVRNLKQNNFLLKISKINLSIEIPVPDYTFTTEFDLIKIENFCFNIYNYPGHTDGSCLIQFKNHLFTGDTLYKKKLGLVNNFGENNKELKNSLSKIYNYFDDNNFVYPGHGSHDYLKNIKINNKEVNDFLYNI